MTKFSAIGLSCVFAQCAAVAATGLRSSNDELLFFQRNLKNNGKGGGNGGGNGGGSSVCGSGTCDADQSVSCVEDSDCPLATDGVCSENTECAAGSGDLCAGDVCQSDDQCLPNNGNPAKKGTCVRSETTCNFVPCPTVTFFAMGDVPYSEMEECLIPVELNKLSTSGFDAEFLIHLGDIRDGQLDPITGEIRPCAESLYQGIAGIFEASPLTTFFVPGDNGWLDCADADESYTFWDAHLFRYNERSDLSWPDFTYAVSRSADHPEFFSFVIDEVLFLGQGLPGSGRDEEHAWTDRDAYMQENYDWTESQFAANAATMKAAVIFGHASATVNDVYFGLLKGLAGAYSNIPILFLEDEHAFATEEGFEGEPNLYRIALDDSPTPTAITVTPDHTGGITQVFQYDIRCPCAEGHRPTNLIFYNSGECAGVCETNLECADLEACSPEGNVC